MKNNFLETLYNATIDDVIADARKTMHAVEQSAFKIATQCAYCYGVEIPDVINGKGVIVIDKPETQGKIANRLNVVRVTVSRWCTAVELIIENGTFSLFYNDPKKYPFSFDKIIEIYKNNLLDNGISLEMLLSLTLPELKKMSKGDDDTDGDGQIEPVELVEIMIIETGEKYKVDKAKLDKILTSAMAEA